MKPNINPNKSRKSSPKVTLPTLIAYNATPQAQRLLVKFGKTPARNVKDLQVKLAQIIKEFGDEGLREIARIHPHRDLILSYSRPNMMEGGDRGDGYYYNNFAASDIPYVTADMGIQQTIMGDFDEGDITRNRLRMYMADGVGAGEKEASKIISAGAIILSVLALGTVLVAFGGEQREFV